MSESTEQRPRILIVDDDANTARLARDWFAGRPYDVLSADDGRSGLAAAAAHQPDVILLDLRMPDVDGISVARQLKADPCTRAVPILLLTACRDVNAKIEAFAAGADDYITKPFEFEEVDARIGAVLRTRRQLVSLESTVRNLRSVNDQLERLSVTDEKTGLFNFREFQRRLLEEWHRADRYDVPLSLVFLDIDHFKAVNDSLGHLAGDRLLQEFATLVAGGARTNDIAARYGGEEFAIILPHTEGGMARRVADRIRSAVADFTFLAQDEPTSITVSAGVATFPAPGTPNDSVDGLVRAADRALYRAKDLGRNRVIDSAALARA